MVSLIFLQFKKRRLVLALQETQAILNQSPDPQAFVERYEVVNAEPERHAMLGGRWQAFRESWFIPRRQGLPVRATARPATMNLPLEAER